MSSNDDLLAPVPALDGVEEDVLRPPVSPKNKPKRTPVRVARVDMERLVEQRLRSSWGRPTNPKKVGGADPGMMHSLIADMEDMDDLSISSQSSECEADDVVRESQWKSILRRCETHPQEAGLLDRRGRNCLHAACSKTPSLEVVQAILKACGRHGDIVLERDKNGRTPLSIAVSSNNDLEVIERLVICHNRAVNVGDHLGNLPLHLACAKYEGDQPQLVALLLDVLPKAAGRENNTGRTPLHTAIENNAPCEVIRMLVEACPQAVVQNGLIGLSPLILAIRRNASIDIIRILVEANPSATTQRDRTGSLPLRRAVEQQAPPEVLELLCTVREVVLDTNNIAGNTALHETLEWSIPDHRIVRLFLRVAPEVAITENRAGQTPLSLACERYIRMLKTGRNRRGSNNMHSLWQSLSLLLRTAHYGKLSEIDEALVEPRHPPSSPTDLPRMCPKQPVLHAAVYIPLPTDVIQTALCLHPEQVSIQDCNGKFPLDLAIAAPTQTNKTATIQILLNAFPQAAAHAFVPRPPGSQSMLSLACQSRAIVGDIFHALRTINPFALRQLCPKYKMYPFQVAALPKAPLPAVTIDANSNPLQSVGDETVNTTPFSSPSAMVATTTTTTTTEATTINNTYLSPSVAALSATKVQHQMSTSGKQRRIIEKWDKPVDEDVLQTNAIYELLVASPDLLSMHL